MDNKKPSWLNGRILSNLLEDEASYLQYGQQSREIFYGFEMSEALPSAWI